jgi:hypothetical protein
MIFLLGLLTLLVVFVLVDSDDLGTRAVERDVDGRPRAGPPRPNPATPAADRAEGTRMGE